MCKYNIYMPCRMPSMKYFDVSLHFLLQIPEKNRSTSGQGTKSGGCDVDFERRKCSNKAASEHGSVLTAQVETNKHAWNTVGSFEKK